MGDRIIPTRCFGDFTLEGVPMGNARRGQRNPEIFESVDHILREGGPHRWIGSYALFVLKELMATVWGSA